MPLSLRRVEFYNKYFLAIRLSYQMQLFAAEQKKILNKIFELGFFWLVRWV